MSTYLGYRVRDLESCEGEVRAWLDAHDEDTLQVSEKTPIGGWSEYSAGDLSAIEDANFSDFTCFEGSPHSCSFTTVNYNYRIEVVVEPCDKWGHATIYGEDPDCVWINFQDDSGNHENEEIGFDLELGEETYSYKENRSEFVKWAEEKAGENDERLDLIYEETICNGTSCSWHYLTLENLESLKELFLEWLSLEGED